MATGFDGVKAGLSSVGDTIKSAGTALGNMILDGLKVLFIPSDSFFNTTFGGFYDTFKSKFPAIDQVKGLFDTFTNGFSAAGETAPAFNINYQGTTVSIIDFSMFDSYRPFIHGIILVIAYYWYVVKVIFRIPSIIGGLSNDMPSSGGDK